MTYKENALAIKQALYQEQNSDAREIQIKNIIVNNKLKDRVNIREYYNQFYAKNNLEDDFEEQLKGNFKDLAKCLFMTPLDYDCDEINKALNKIGYSKKNVFEILTLRSPDYIQKIKSRYKELYKEDLDILLKDKFDKTISQNLNILAETERNVNPNPDANEMKLKAEALVKTKEVDWLENRNLFEEIFAKCSPEELVMIGRLYYGATQKDLTGALNNDLLKEIVFNAIKPNELYARKLQTALHFIADTNTVNRIVALKNETDMDMIKKYYYYLYRKELTSDVINKFSGNYKDLLIDLIDGKKVL